MTQPVPPILYKYMSTDRIGFFDAPQLRFTPPAEFNDIFDCHFRTKGLFSRDFLIEQANAHAERDFDKILDEKLMGMGFSPAMVSQLTRHERAEIKKRFTPFFEQLVAQTVPSSATEEIREKLSQAIHDGLGQIGVLCLTPNNASTSMWGIYATGPKGQGNMGFAVGFDTSNEFFNRKLTQEDALRHLRPVSYPENPPERYLSDYLKEQLPEQSILLEALYIKDKKEWGTEREWRMVITMPENSTSEIFGLEDVPIDAIKEVFLGVFADSNLEAAASAFCKQHEIPLYRMKKSVDRVLKPKPIP